MTLRNNKSYKLHDVYSKASNTRGTRFSPDHYRIPISKSKLITINHATNTNEYHFFAFLTFFFVFSVTTPFSFVSKFIFSERLIPLKSGIVIPLNCPSNASNFRSFFFCRSVFDFFFFFDFCFSPSWLFVSVLFSTRSSKKPFVDGLLRFLLVESSSFLLCLLINHTLVNDATTYERLITLASRKYIS